MAAKLAGREDVERSNSPPGRESREDWWSGGNAKNGRPPISDRLGVRKEPSNSRSRSRSPISKGRGSDSPIGKEERYSREGTNTTSREPHLERARLFVGNIEPGRTHRRDITRLFSKYGDVLGVSVHKGFAFVQMDRERTANKAINFEDNQIFMGSRIHVEFSQAALKAGAKIEPLPLRSPPPREREFLREPPPYRDREPPYRDREPPFRDREPPFRDREPSYRDREPPYRDREPPYREREYREPRPPVPEYYHLDEQEKQREERLARILQMEREIAMLRTQQETGGSLPPSRDSYRRSPPPSHGYDSFSRDRDPPYRGGNGDRGGSRYYTRQSPSELSRGQSGDGFREPISYPSQFSGGSGRPTTAGVGYGGAGGSGKSITPPGWPGGLDKSSVNRPPFTSNGPWS